MKLETDTSGKWVKTEIAQSYIEEVRLSRELANAIAQEIKSFGQVIPHSVHVAWKRLADHYAKQIEDGVM